jgi:hypothetical protein
VVTPIANLPADEITIEQALALTNRSCEVEDITFLLGILLLLLSNSKQLKQLLENHPVIHPTQKAPETHETPLHSEPTARNPQKNSMKDQLGIKQRHAHKYTR